MATAPNPREIAAKRRAEAAANFRIIVSVDGTDHVFRLSEVTAVDVGDLRRATGLGVLGLTRGLASTLPDADMAAAAVWLARRQAGERSLTYAAVADGLTYGQAVSARHEDEAEIETEDGGFVDPPA